MHDTFNSVVSLSVQYIPIDKVIYSDFHIFYKQEDFVIQVGAGYNTLKFKFFNPSNRKLEQLTALPSKFANKNYSDGVYWKIIASELLTKDLRTEVATFQVKKTSCCSPQIWPVF